MSTTVQQEWNNALRAQHRQLGRKYASSIDALRFDVFQSNLEKMRVDYKSQTAAKCISRLSPVFEQLNTFHQGLLSMASANEGSSIVWGVVMVLVTAASNYSQLLEEFSDIMEELTVTVTRINRYLKLLPTNVRLQSLSVDIFNDYVQCCIAAVKFYKTKPLYNLVKFFWKNLRKTFQEARNKVHTKITSFEKEIRVNIDEIIVSHARGSPPKAGLPPRLFSVPFGENEFFCGRQDVFQQIDGILSQTSSPKQPSCLIHAMGGMGKTQVALAYAHRRKKEYPYIFWLNSQKETELATNFSDLALKLGFLNHQSLGESQKVNIVRDWLETTASPWLLIFDNAESIQSLRPYWPSSSQNGAVLVTSQIISLAQSIRSHIDLQPLDEEGGADLLLYTLQLTSPSASERKAAMAIARLVGGLPIAISHIAGSMFSTQLSLDEAIKMFEQQKYTYLWSGENVSSTHIYNQRLDMVWDIALNELSDVEKHLLNILSLLSPDSISEDMILGGQELGFFEPSFTNVFPRVRSSLARRQLVQRNASATDHYLSLHRSLQLNLRERLSEDESRYVSVFNEAVNLVRRVFPAQHKAMSVENDNWAHYDRYSPHIRALHIVAQASQNSIVNTSLFAQLLSDSANYYWERGFLTLGLETCRFAVQIFESLPQTDPIAYTQPLTLQGLMAGELGIEYRKEMFECYIKCLQIRGGYLEGVPGGGDRDEILLYGNAWGDLCCGCLDSGYYDELEKYANVKLALKSRVASEKTHAMFFGSGYMILAYAYASQKRFTEARAYMTRTLEMAATDYKFRTAAYQKFVFFEACIIKEAGDLETALRVHNGALKERLDIFGPFAGQTRYSYYAIGEVHYLMGSLAQAETMLRRSLESLDRSEWLDVAVARSRFLLSKVLQEKVPSTPSQLTEAKHLHDIAHSCRTRVMPNPEQIFEGPIFDPASCYDLMVSFTGRTKLLHDKVKQRAPQDQFSIPDSLTSLQYQPCYTYWSPEARDALLCSLGSPSL